MNLHLKIRRTISQLILIMSRCRYQSLIIYSLFLMLLGDDKFFELENFRSSGPKCLMLLINPVLLNEPVAIYFYD